jgi:hypothetical protein
LVGEVTRDIIAVIDFIMRAFEGPWGGKGGSSSTLFNLSNTGETMGITLLGVDWCEEEAIVLAR